MALRGSTTEGDTARTDAPGATQDTQNAARAPGLSGDRSGSLFSMMSQLVSAQSMGVDAEKYLDTIKAIFARDTNNRIEIRRLAEPQGAHAFILGNAAVIMLFQSMLMADTQHLSPVSDYAFIASRSLDRNLRLLTAIIVSPGDYERAQQQAFFIQNSLLIATNPEFLESTVQVLTGMEFQVDPDTAAARQFINDRNPHAVQPRVDIGFVLHAKTPRRSSNHMTVPFDDVRPIAAVGGYTEIIMQPDQAGTPKYIPLIHITSIASHFPVPGIIPLLLALAADQFISTRRWLQPFSSFQKGRPNLGQLSLDPKNNKDLWFTQDTHNRDLWIHANMLTTIPLMCIDVCEGQWRIPQLSIYGFEEYSMKVYDQIKHFFDGKVALDTSVPPYRIQATSYIGTFGDEQGRLIDSRELDYLNLVARSGAQDEGARVLLQYPANPSVRARVLADKTGGQFRSLYRGYLSVLDGRLLGALATSVVSSLNISSTQRQDRMTSTDWMMGYATSYSAQNFNTQRADARSMGWDGGNIYNI